MEVNAYYMPSTTLQARINAFESLSSPSSTATLTISPSPSPNASDILETPISPIAAETLQPVTLFTKVPVSPSPSPSPPNLGRKTSLIDLKDWVIDDGPSSSAPDVTRTPTQNVLSAKRPSADRNANGTPTTFEPPPKPKPKPANLSAPAIKPPPHLPPRKPSCTSLKSVGSSSSPRNTDSLTVDYAHRYPPLTNVKTSGHGPSSSISSFHSVSLSSDTDPTSPGSAINFIATYPMDEERSFHSQISRSGDTDSISLSESYEEVSTSSLASPTTERMITLDWEQAMAKRKTIPPRLPERPKSSPKATSSWHPISRVGSRTSDVHPATVGNTPSQALSASSKPAPPIPYTPRRAAPPPPSRSSDRSSIQSVQSNTTTSSSQSHNSGSMNPQSILSLKSKRPTPVPQMARKRYEMVFNANVIQRRRAEKQKQPEKPALLSPVESRSRRAAGWRGLSVDLITAEVPLLESENVDEVVGSTDKLEGAIVKLIWRRSGLDDSRLGQIWKECDNIGQGTLNFDAFVKGMWRIDEELRRMQALSGTVGSRRPADVRTGPKTPQKSRDILL